MGSELGLKLLVAEDCTVNQRIVLRLLDELGYCADVAGNGREAIAYLALTPCDLVLMDCEMPDMDGYQAARMIRDPKSQVLDHGVPIVAMTAHTHAEAREQCLASGMNDCVIKPFDADQLGRAIDRVLKAR